MAAGRKIMTQQSLFAPPAVTGKKAPRDYQVEAVEAMFDYFSEHDGAPLVVVPTGGGKSLIIAHFIERANAYFPGTRVLVITHSAILLTQNAEELYEQWPDVNASFYSDKLGQKDLSGDIIFAGIQSFYKKAYHLTRAIDLCIVDEAHAISPDEDTMYQRLFADLRMVNPQIKFIGVTATPFRAGYGMLHRGEKAIFTHIAYEINLTELIARGYLCPLVTPEGGVRTKIDASGCKVSKGDYVNKQLAKIVDDEVLTKACVDEIVFFGEDRNKWIVFTVDIAHCTKVTEEIRSRGVSCDMVHSKMDTAACNRVIDDYKAGKIKCLVNVAMLTTGANFPAIDLLANLRPMKSPVLYVQVAGRGMRTFPGKENCLFLDFGGVIEQLGPVDQIRVAQKGDGTGEAPIKYCPGELPNGKICGATLHAANMKCPYCGHEFPEPGLNLSTTASDAAALSTQLKAKMHKVSRIACFVHKKEGVPDTMRVDYLCGFETYREWWSFDATGMLRERACNWWRERSTSTAIPPRSVAEAVNRQKELQSPLYVYAKKVGKYHTITGYEFTEPQEQEITIIEQGTINIIEENLL